MRFAEPRQARRSSPRATNRRPGSPRQRARLCGEQPRELSTFSNSLQGAYFTGIKQGSQKHTAFRARPPPPPDLPHRPGSAAQGPWERRRPPGRPRLPPPPGHPGHSPPPPRAGGTPGPPALARGAEPRGPAGEQNFADSAPCRPEGPRAPSPRAAPAKPGFAERCCILGTSPVLRPQLEAPPPR